MRTALRTLRSALLVLGVWAAPLAGQGLEPRAVDAPAHFGQDFGLSLGAVYGWGGESTVDDVPKDDRRSTLLFGPSFGCRISASRSLRLAYVRTGKQNDVGSDTHSLGLGWAFRS